VFPEERGNAMIDEHLVHAVVLLVILWLCLTSPRRAMRQEVQEMVQWLGDAPPTTERPLPITSDMPDFPRQPTRKRWIDIQDN
jgi:hypothetical protein